MNYTVSALQGSVAVVQPAHFQENGPHHIDSRRADEVEKDRNMQKVAQTFKSLYPAHLEDVEPFVSQIFEAQQAVPAGKAVCILPAENPLKGEMVITSNRIHLLKGQVGKGAYSEVFSTIVIATKRHDLSDKTFSPSKPVEQALKRATRGTSFSPVKIKLEQAQVDRKRGIDQCLETFKDDKGVGYSLNELYQGDLTKITFAQMDQPVLAMIQTLISCSLGLESLHSAQRVHRDLKGGNILYHSSSEDASSSSIERQIEGALTDFDFLQVEKQSSHPTIGTPEYLDPSMFGPLELCILNQRKRVGRQSKEGDVYALGMTIYMDVLLRFFRHLAGQDPARAKILGLEQKINPIYRRGKFSDKHLIEYGKQSCFRVVHRLNEDRTDTLIKYPKIASLREGLKEICTNLQGILKPSEIQGLNALCSLCCDMQETDLTVRPKIEAVVEALREMERCLKRGGISLLNFDDDDAPDQTILNPPEKIKEEGAVDDHTSPLPSPLKKQRNDRSVPPTEIVKSDQGV
jgi:serine/threonine protein kinase